MALSQISTLLTFSVTLLLVLTAKGQTSETPSCAQSLVPCANYINSTNPPSSCCGPLKTAVETQITCLCNLYNTPGLLQSFGINITDALSLSKRCKLSADLNDCVKASGPTSSTTPPASPGGNDKDGASTIAGTGLLSILVSFCAYIVLF